MKVRLRSLKVFTKIKMFKEKSLNLENFEIYILNHKILFYNKFFIIVCFIIIIKYFYRIN